MYSYLSIAIISWLAYWIVTTIAGLQHNIALAKASGLPYHVSGIGSLKGFEETTNMEKLLPGCQIGLS